MKVLISDKISDSSFSIFKKHKISFDFKPEITPDELLAVIKDYDGLIVRSRTKVTKEVIEKGVRLKVIGRAGSGVDNIDVEACKKKNINVINTPGANSQAVAEHTIGLILSVLRNYKKAYVSMEQGLWLKKELGGGEICGKTVGIVGYGHIGKKVEELVKAFGAKVQVYSRSFKTCELEELFSSSDIITIHLALTPNTKELVGKTLLESMKPSAIIINASRGKIINEKALIAVLQEKKIKGAGLDVFYEGPLPVDSILRKMDNVVLTPHIAASTKEALVRASIDIVDSVTNKLKVKSWKSKIRKLFINLRYF